MAHSLIFDFDGTIADSVHLTLNAIKEIIKKYNNRVLTDKEIDELRNMKIQDVIKTLHISIFKVPFFANELRKSLRFDYGHVKPIRGMDRVLKDFHKAGYQLGIVTSNSEENVATFLGANRLEVFDFIYTGSSLFGKGNLLKRLVKENNIEREYCFYIGDETRDIDASKKSNIRSVAVTWGINTKEILVAQHPDFVIDIPAELLRIVR